MPSRTEIATIGPSSPYAPCFITVSPKGVPSIPLSLRMGSSVPSAVEVSAMATAISAWIAPPAPSAAITPAATAKDATQVASARRPPRPTSSGISIS